MVKHKLKIARHAAEIDLIIEVVADALSNFTDKDLFAMDISLECLKDFEKLSVVEINTLKEKSEYCFDSEGYFDANRFSIIVNDLATSITLRQRQDILLEAGAVTPLMHYLYGMSAHECAFRKKMLGAKGVAGRIKHLTDKEELRLLKLWDQLDHLSEEERFLRIVDCNLADIDKAWNCLILNRVIVVPEKKKQKVKELSYG